MKKYDPIIFAIGFAVMMTILEIGSLHFLRERAWMQSKFATENCFIHRHYDESC
jgi:hypothetical protein